MPSLKGLRTGSNGECMCALCTKLSTKAVVFTPTKATTKATPTTTPTTVDVRTQPQHHATTTPTTATPTTQITNNVRCDITRRHASLPQQRAPNWIANAPAHNVLPIAPFIPMQHQMPFFYNCVAQIGPCCAKYGQWLANRRGRPPHHPLCPKR